MTTPLWLCEEGPDQDVAVSTRARLARNLPDFPFPHRASLEQRRMAAQRIREAAKVSELIHLKPERLSKLSEQERTALVAAHLLSPKMVSTAGLEERWILRDSRGALSLLIHEEDHLRIQAFGAGCSPEQVYDIALGADNALQKGLTFASDKRLGYLTASLANVGTGLRLSVLLHLPALQWQADLERHFAAVCALGGTVRGLRGEGSQAPGALFQVSHEITYRPEQAPLFFVRCVAAATSVLIQAEREARTTLTLSHSLSLTQALEATRSTIEDAGSLGTEAALELLSRLRLFGLTGLKVPLSPRRFAEAVVTLQSQEGVRADLGRVGLLRRLVREDF